MYTDEYEERGFPIRSFLIKFIIIVIIILLLIWLLPKFIKPKNDKKIVNNKAQEEEVYQNNIESMQNAAFKYYNANNLPKENGKYKQVTLKELIEEDYTKSLKNSDGKNINTTKSYIKITKVDENEYVLKINIKDTDVEDYVLLNVGHFDYCDDYLCEKQEEQTETKEEKAQKEDKKTKEEKIVDTKVKASEEEVETENRQPIIVDETYKYIKTIPAKLSAWSDWSNWEEIACTIASNSTCSNNNTKCLAEIKTIESNGTCYESYRTRKVLTSSYTITRYSTKDNQELLNDGWVYIGK